MRIGVLSGAKAGPRAHNNRRFIYEIEQAGHTPEIINYNRTFASILESGRELYRLVNGDTMKPIRVDVVIPRMGSSTVKGLIALEMLASQGVPSTASAESIRIAGNKFRTQLVLDQHGIPTPYSLAPTGRVPKNVNPLLDAVEQDRTRPVITKPWGGSQGKGVVISDTRRSAISHAHSISRRNPFMIQEFIDPIEEGEFSDYRVITVDGKDMVAMRRTSTNQDDVRSNLCLSGVGNTVELTSRERELAQRASEIVGSGFLGVDLMRSNRGPLITEVNSNPNLGIEGITGFNVVQAVVEYAVRLGEERA